MASIATTLPKIPSSLPSSSKRDPSPFSSNFLFISTKKRPSPSLRRFPLSPRATAKTSGTWKPSAAGVERVHQVHSIAEFEAALRSAKNKLVVVEYAASQSPDSRSIYPCMVDLSRTCDDVDFLLVMGDESDETRELCRREGIDKVPHFSFYKGMEKLHEEEGIGPDQLVGDVLYYGDKHAGVVQLHCREDVEALIDEHRGTEGKLVVLDVGLKHCGPCVKVYPTVIKLSRSMADAVVFARMNGDENDSCMEFLKDMDVVQVPTFLFLRDGKICGRYVGSGKGELIGEILRYQGMLATEIKNKAVIFTGHSVGGALASLAALHFLCSSSCSPSPSTLFCITFGSPFLGNEALSVAVQRERWCGNFCHVVTRHDIVPRLLFCPLNQLPPRLVTHLLQSWQLLLQCHQVARPASVLSDQEKAQLHILISMHIDAAANQQEISAATRQRSPYWPFGNYALCSVEGVVCFDNPLIVARMLYSTFMTGSASSSFEEEHLSYGDVFTKVLENLLLKKRIAIEEVPESNFCAGISLALEASGIGNQDMEAIKARECLKMSKRMGCSPNLISASLAIKLGKITPWRAQIEWYKASCDDDMGYYDSFKLRKAPKKDSWTNLNRHRLAKFWDDLMDMLQNNQLPHDFHKRGKWVNAAHFYKLLVEPLDIAEYYRVQMHEKKGHYLTHGRERRYQVFDRWWRNRKKDSYEGDDLKRSKFAGLTQDSCFWAKVEMAREWLEDTTTESDPVKLARLLENLKGFQSYAKQMVERKEVSMDVVAPRSSYTLWVEEWKVLQLNSGFQIAP